MKKQEEDLFNSVSKEHQIKFPIYFRNKQKTRYVCYNEDYKFEEVNINKDNEAFQGSIIFGYNHQQLIHKNDIWALYREILRVNEIIEKEEYEEVFAKVTLGREEFFTESKYEYIEPVYLSQNDLNKYIKHKWRPL